MKYDTITVDEVIARAKMQLRISNTTEHDLFLEVLAEESLRRLSPLDMYIKRMCKLEVVDRKAKLPKGFYKLIGLRYVDPTVTGDACNFALYVDSGFLSDCECDTSIATSSFVRDQNQGFQIVGNYIHFNQDIGITEATLAFIGMNYNDSDRLIVYERYEVAMAFYLCYMFALSFPFEYNQNTIDRFNRQWVAQRAKVRGEAAASQFQFDKREVQNAFTALATSATVNF